MNRSIVSESLTFESGDDPLNVPRLVDHRTGNVLGEDLRQVVLVRFPDRLSDPVVLRDATAGAVNNGLEISLRHSEEHVTARLLVDPDSTALRFRLHIEAPAPIWMVEWTLHGIEVDEVIVPALGGQSIGRSMPVGRELAFKFPFWWNAQFVIGAMEGGGGVWMYTREKEAGLRVLRVRRERAERGFVMGLGFEAKAPLRATRLEAEWRLEAFSGPWTGPVDTHRDWLRTTHALCGADEHPHAPAWVRDIDLILEIWGMRKDTGMPAHTFEEMVERIEAVAAQRPAEHTLLYLPGFAESGIDSNAPSYAPAPELGGADGLRALVDRAHALGYRVMLHTNVLAMAFSHPLFREFEPYQVVDPFGRPQTWGLDIDGDWLHEPFFAYINPAAEAWTNLMSRTIGDLIEDFGIDAIFLDQTLLAFNDSRGPDFLKGMANHVRRLQQTYPHTLFAGEGLHERVLPVLPVAQIHGLDSIADVHGLEGVTPWRRIHPVSVRLFGPFTRLLAHLLTAHPDSEPFQRQQSAYDRLGVIPALVLWDRTQSVDSPAVRDLLARRGRHGDSTPVTEVVA